MLRKTPLWYTELLLFFIQSKDFFIPPNFIVAFRRIERKYLSMVLLHLIVYKQIYLEANDSKKKNNGLIAFNGQQFATTLSKFQHHLIPFLFCFKDTIFTWKICRALIVIFPVQTWVRLSFGWERNRAVANTLKLEAHPMLWSRQ